MTTIDSLPSIGALLALFAVLASVALFGPALSPRELAWMANYSRTTEGVVHGPPWQFALRIWLSLGPVLGDPWTIAIALAAAFLLVRAARDGARQTRDGDLPLVARSIAAVILLGALLAIGPILPRIGATLYPSRFAPLLVLATAKLVDRALSRIRAGRASSRMNGVGALRIGAARAQWLEEASPKLALLVTLALFAVAIPQQLRVYQRAQPLATFADLRAIDCLDRAVPNDAVIESADGDASEWIPALTRRRITTPHKHCSLFDEIDAALAPLHPAYRFRGEAWRGAMPGSSAAPAICTSGDAHLWPLSPPR